MIGSFKAVLRNERPSLQQVGLRTAGKKYRSHQDGFLSARPLFALCIFNPFNVSEKVGNQFVHRAKMEKRTAMDFSTLRSHIEAIGLLYRYRADCENPGARMKAIAVRQHCLWLD